MSTSNSTLIDDDCANIGGIDFAAFRSTGNAYPTSRALSDGAEEWAEPGMVEQAGEQIVCRAVYLFAAKDVTRGDGTPREAEDYPWDADHISAIHLVEPQERLATIECVAPSEVEAVTLRERLGTEFPGAEVAVSVGPQGGLRVRGMDYAAVYAVVKHVA